MDKSTANAYKVALDLIDEEMNHEGLGDEREQELKDAYRILADLSTTI